MIRIGNFFFKYRNILFIGLYLLLFIPSPKLFQEKIFGANYHLWPLITGLTITILGQLMRGATIGLAYIIRGGQGGKVHADGLVTEGLFSHCRNPLYIGNILMLFGVGILANSLLYIVIVMPIFLFIYQSIVLAEEKYLANKFGNRFDEYCREVHRWIPDFSNIGATMRSMKFHWRRWLTKEYNTQFVWLTGISLIIVSRYPHPFDNSLESKVLVLSAFITLNASYYFFVRYMKKSKKWHD